MNLRSLSKFVDAWKKSHFLAKVNSLLLLYDIFIFTILIVGVRAAVSYCVNPSFSLNVLSVFLEPLMIILVVATVLFYVFVMPLILNLIITLNTINHVSLAISLLVAFITFAFIIIFDVTILTLSAPT